jgi:hypothetical protein
MCKRRSIRRAPVHSITSSARSKIDGGIARPSALAVLRFTEDRRSPDQWWMLGEYLVYDGLLEESDAVTNDGIGVLMKGAGLPEPSVGCLLDLAWVLAFKGMDAMALPYIERAASIAPESRDVAALKAHIHLVARFSQTEG